MNFEARLDKVTDFEVSTLPYTVTPNFSELDANNHVNNTKYANFVLDAINPEDAFEIDIFQIDYRKEVLQGTQLNIYHTKNDNIVFAKGQSSSNDIMFACKIEYK
jgi:acyl-ACP thioesterase